MTTPPSMPLCDTCVTPVAWSEMFGWRHATADHPYGLSADLDTTGHEPTAKAWAAETWGTTE
jgi:hypothetical protein